MAVMSAGCGAWKAWYGAFLLDYTKLKKEMELYMAREFIYMVAQCSIIQRGAYVRRTVVS